MQDFPHHYRVSAVATEEGNVSLESAGLAPIASAGPVEFRLQLPRGFRGRSRSPRELT
jgi:hypothetical protein